MKRERASGVFSAGWSADGGASAAGLAAGGGVAGGWAVGCCAAAGDLPWFSIASAAVCGIVCRKSKPHGHIEKGNYYDGEYEKCSFHAGYDNEQACCVQLEIWRNFPILPRYPSKMGIIHLVFPGARHRLLLCLCRGR